MIMLEEKEETERYEQFLLHLHANPMTDEVARGQFAKAIEPQYLVVKKVGTMKTDLEQLKALKAQQEKGG